MYFPSVIFSLKIKLNLHIPHFVNHSETIPSSVSQVSHTISVGVLPFFDFFFCDIDCYNPLFCLFAKVVERFRLWPCVGLDLEIYNSLTVKSNTVKKVEQVRRKVGSILGEYLILPSSMPFEPNVTAFFL